MTNEIITWDGDKVTVDLAETALLIEKGSKITTTPKAEAALLAILAIKDLGEQLEAMAKERVGAAIEELRKTNPKLTSITSDKLNIRYQQYGERYKLDPQENVEKLVEQNLAKTRISYKPITEAIDGFKEKYGQLPQGVLEVDRPKQLTFTPKKAKA